MTHTERLKRYEKSERPAIALITNHGYAGADLPIAGAPDTGGQNHYVNSLAHALEELGYRVTIFARGGFPFFESQRMRSEPEMLSDHIRYIFIPGGGDAFIRKEDIAVALDEEVEWLYRFIGREAEAAGCDPWRVYELLNTHYWDAGVMGVQLVERWRDDIAARDIAAIVESIVPDDAVARMVEERHFRSVGEVPGYTLGHLLLSAHGDASTNTLDRVRAAVARWTSVKGGAAKAQSYLLETVGRVVETAGEGFSPDLEPILAANALGPAALSLSPDVDARLKMDLQIVDRHVWTPHSLGDLKDYNFRNRPEDSRRNLKFCERRSHERMVCSRTRAFAATSNDIAQQLWTHYRVPIEQTFYFPPCLDTHRFRPYDDGEMTDTYAYLAETTGVAEAKLRDAKIVFETSRMDRTKRKDLLLAAFAKIPANGHETGGDTLLVIGGGPRNDVSDALREQITHSDQLRGRAFLLGPVPEAHIAQMFSLADVYVTPSEMEGFGMSASEAAAAGTALVSSDAVPFAVHHVPDDALICPQGDADAFAGAIKQLLDDGDDRQRRATRLKDRMQTFDWVAGTKGFLDHVRQHAIPVAEGRPDQ
ncbi:MAG: glycosyltransferase family 1 protein [Planctomycetes bacterium]|nr:glycosyltransferase family 1 protein [Planctomycetota bacterium]